MFLHPVSSVNNQLYYDFSTSFFKMEKNDFNYLIIDYNLLFEIQIYSIIIYFFRL